ncbi:MAG: translation elongation factor Ts [Mycobacterium leprae]
MAEITAKMVADLRAKTGAGMMDCKKALTEAQGDIEKATDWLREKGLAAAAKKASRIAAEGRIYSLVPEITLGTMVEVNCETDFVGKGDEFKALCHDVAEVILAKNPADIDALNATLGDKIINATAKIGEKISVRRFARYQVAKSGLVHSYIHGDGRVGVLIELETASDAVAAHAEVKNLAQELALQVASMKARYVDRTEVPGEEIEHEKEILKAQAINEGKKPEIAEKMVQGRIAKYYQEYCLVDQEWVKDSSKTCGQLVKEVAGKAGGDIRIVRFVRWEKGEGIEKRSDDFAAEVAKAAGLNK